MGCTKNRSLMFTSHEKYQCVVNLCNNFRFLICVVVDYKFKFY